MTTGYPRGSCRENWRARENVGRGGKEKQWTDCVAEDRRLFGIAGDASTTALDPTVSYNTLRQWGCCRFMAGRMKEEEKASEHRQRKIESEEAGKVEVASGVTV